jgi:hypothetical protein
MTFAQATTSQHAALEGAMRADCFGCIIGTAWIKTAILSQKRADAQFVESQQEQ